MAEYDSDCSSSAISGTETVSTSGLGHSNVAIFCHETLTNTAIEAKRILMEDNLTTCISCVDAPAGRGKLENLYSVATNSDLRVFVITDKLVKTELNYHRRILENADLSTKENTLLLMKKNQLQNIPKHLRDYTCSFFESRITGDGIAELINHYRYKDATDDESVLSVGSQSQPAIISNEEARSQQDLQEYGMKYQKFEDTFGKVTKKRCYILVASPIRDGNPALGVVASIPWVRVFDFDPESSIKGLSLWTDNALKKKNHTKTNKPWQVQPPDDNVTNWVYVAGDVDNFHALQKQGEISETTIYRHGETLTDYCIGRKVPVVLVMWYSKSSELVGHLEDFLRGLRHHFAGRLHCFNCVVCLDKMPQKKSRLRAVLEKLKLMSSAIVVPLEILCTWLQSCVNESYSTSDTTITLPKQPDDGDVLENIEIEEEDLLWIRSQLYVLVTKQTSETLGGNIPKSIRVMGSAFLRGGEIVWDVVEYGGYDVRRDSLEKVKKYIKSNHIRTGKTGLVTIFHAPGGGGTTFARRLLFELHDIVPSGELIADKVTHKSLEDRLIFLRNLTMLPTVILLDGNSMHDVKILLSLGNKMRIIVIHVRRYTHESDKVPTGDGQFFLSANVSSDEAPGFAEIYGKDAPQKQAQLKALSKKPKDSMPYIFEYGLTAFESNYTGVRNYVHGYLQVDANTQLQNWHTVLVFLSMADYYGHRGLPCKLFSKIIEKPDTEIVELSDLPHAARQFITEAGESWKITHYVVSKLILEQVLVKRSSTNYESQNHTLTKEASQELSHWALMFIDNIKEYVGNSRMLGSDIWEILTSIFIRRNYDEPGEKELGSKTHYSKLVEDINSNVQQKAIFKRLVDKFPDHAEFRAHLGRFHSKQGEFNMAEKCFEEALEKRKRETREAKHNYELSKADDVLERIYNMSAFACISNIRSEIGTRMGRMRHDTLTGRNRPSLIRFCLDKASKAITNFEKGRLHSQSGSNPSFANLGELKIRLQLAELACYVSDRDLESLRSKPPPYKELGEFVFESFHACDMLLAECISDRSRNIDLPGEEIDYCFNHFNYFFDGATKALKKWAGDDSSLHSMKCHLSILKDKLRPKDNYFSLKRDVKHTNDVKKLVGLCEGICDLVWKNNRAEVRISSYMTEWLRAIRHEHMDSLYSLTSVLARVEIWDAKQETSTLAAFYHYVLATVLSLSSISRETADTYAKTSHKLKELLRKSDTIPLHMYDTNEWLGRGGGVQNFNKLIHSSALGGWKGKFWANSDKISRLEVCSGSIAFCRSYDGIIVMDGGRDPPIQVFFVPQKYDISVSHSWKKTRVEFYLGFNPRHLAQAFEVQLLKKYNCPNLSCNTPTEIPTLGKDPCECETPCNFCDTMVRIPQGSTSDE